MKNINPIFLFSVLFLTSGCAVNQSELLYNKRPASYSYIVGDIQNNYITAEHMADVYVSPSSCQKTISALLAYKTLGANYRYETTLQITKKNRKIHHIIISFAGDPLLTSDDLVQLLEPIGNAKITGQVILDASIFKTPPHSPNIMLDDLGTDYGQPVSSMNLDKNLIMVSVLPNKQLEKQAIVTNDSGYPTDSKITTTTEPSSIKISIKNNRIEAKGTININDVSLKPKKISPLDFNDYILRKIKKILRKSNIKSKVVIIQDRSLLPIQQVLVNSVKSEQLGDIIPPALKKSDNLVFDSLYLKIINSQNNSNIESWSDGNSVIKNLIYKYFNIDTKNSVFVDGSGLSRYNIIQPKQLFSILKKGYATPMFVAALASPGENHSTLAKRTKLAKYIRAKTGNMSGISCLCGYSNKNHPQAFVIIATNFAPPNETIHPILDSFVNNYLGQ